MARHPDLSQSAVRRAVPNAQPTLLACVALLAFAASMPRHSVAQTCSHPQGNVPFAVVGDVNGNGAVNVADGLCAVLGSLAELAGQPLSNLTCLASEPLRADINCDGAIDLVDVMACVSIALGTGTPATLSPTPQGCPAACVTCAAPGSSSCFIGGCVPEGQRTGADACQVCDPAQDTAGWTAETCEPYFYDGDGDDYGLTGVSQCQCAEVGAFSTTAGGDCADDDPDIHPEAAEVCDGIDNDCDGDTDTGCSPDADGLTCQSILDANPGAASGLYFIDPDGNGGADPSEAYCDFQTPGQGWTLAMRFGTSSGYTFYSPHWTSGAAHNEASAPGNPLFNGDAKFPAFLSEPGVAIRGCMKSSSSSAVTCRSYALPSTTTLHNLFTSTPVGSDSQGSGSVILSAQSAEADAWVSMASVGGAQIIGPHAYKRVAINLDDDQSCYDARVRFGAAFNNEASVYTLNDAVGFGASAHFSGTCDYEGTDAPWSVGCGSTSNQGLFTRQGTIWVRAASGPAPLSSCRAILAANPAATDGSYTIDIDGPGGPLLPTQVFCDMPSGFTFQLQGTVQNSSSSILGGCQHGFEPFAVRSQLHAIALEDYVLAQGSNAGNYYYANVFTGPVIGCPAVSNQFGWLTNAGATWNDAHVDESGLLVTNNCNSGGWDPVPLNETDGYTFRDGATVLYNPSEFLHTGTVVCGLNDVQASIETCSAHLAADPQAPTGQYVLDPDGPGGAEPFLGYCEMDMQGGGWTLAGVQVPSELYSTRTTADINPQNFGQILSTWRYGNAKIQSLVPAETWLIQSRLSSTKAIVDNAYFRPQCVIDWDKNVGIAEGGLPDDDCQIAYTNTSFSAVLGGTYVDSNYSLGIGQNNSGQYCSIRMANNNQVSTGFQARPCQFGAQSTHDLYLWMR